MPEIQQRPRTGLPLVLWDERMSTAYALNAIQRQGGSTRGRKADVDSLAAAKLYDKALSGMVRELGDPRRTMWALMQLGNEGPAVGGAGRRSLMDVGRPVGAAVSGTEVTGSVIASAAPGARPRPGR